MLVAKKMTVCLSLKGASSNDEAVSRKELLERDRIDLKTNRAINNWPIEKAVERSC